MKDNNGTGNLKCAFSLNPLISEIAIWNDSEILYVRPEFAVLDQATRVAEICKQLLLKDVARVDFQSPPIWTPVDRIERDCGGSKIVACSRYELANPISAEDGRKFKKVIAGQFRRRLKFIVKKCVLAFEAYNLGLTEINGVDDVGMLRWRLTADGAHASGSKATY
ncbi:hypothetical protein [Bradyrhizobium sp. 62]|uniref:hypothetical protein n=1 Tax=Bradyrhizobium sp. 62 TaxID=1043588 RepID=UPI001FFB35D8|nr:hypothetical protein [Bradyrhizobium sp. 62]MCK1364081.1 hypothetical protein [Bradyrhizobium sp. 62]